MLIRHQRRLESHALKSVGLCSPLLNAMPISPEHAFSSAKAEFVRPGLALAKKWVKRVISGLALRIWPYGRN